jgi:fructose-specific phosphotransferase system IIA component
MQLSELISESSISLDLKGKNKYQIIEELVDILHSEDRLAQKDLVLQDIIDREQYLSTGLENGLAVPHGKSKGVTKLCIAFGVIKKGIEFDSLDGKPTNLVFLLISPKDTSGPHIRALAQITRKLRFPETREALLSADSKQKVLSIFKELETE